MENGSFFETYEQEEQEENNDQSTNMDDEEDDEDEENDDDTYYYQEEVQGINGNIHINGKKIQKYTKVYQWIIMKIIIK